jgi:hypothetical protein
MFMMLLCFLCKVRAKKRPVLAPTTTEETGGTGLNRPFFKNYPLLLEYQVQRIKLPNMMAWKWLGLSKMHWQ